MSKGPGLFSGIGKKARDILNANYTTDHKFSVNTCSDGGVVLTSTAVQKGGLSAGNVTARYKYNNALIDVKVDTDSNILTTITINEVVPSTKAIASLKLPDYNSGKLEVQYFHHHATIATAAALNQSPLVDVAATIGTPTIAFGAEAGYDVSSGNLTKYTAGIGVSKPEQYASVILGDKGDSIRASYVHYLDASKKTTAALEIFRKFSANENIVTVGGTYAVDNLTLVKGKLNNNGKLGAVLQHEIIPKSVLSISGEIDTKALERAPKFGLSLALAP
ncbi:hypothetical protein MLD38_030283 [Melastoma candidum]|uniref:Uncharacterized protein n=1 Tax=Melastoma candidum TaxID=119954 RepID=A0ACB9MLA1_9MYRT|nr:hypothetical protein MLD38_030283 [Melastoma candidum]